MDGTLANVSEIKYHVDLNDPRNSGHKDFASFHSASIDAPPNQWVVDLARELNKVGIHILVVTARKFKWSYHTVVWLRENDVPYSLLQMRPDNDSRSDVQIKKDIAALLKFKYRLILALEDNPHVAKLWSDLFIPTVLVPGWTSNAKPGTTFDNSTTKSSEPTNLELAQLYV